MVAKEDKPKDDVKSLKTVDCTINLSKALHKIQFKKRAPRAIRAIKSYTEKIMKTKDVRIDTMLNKHIWSKGIKNVPSRVRVRMMRVENKDEMAKEKMYTLVRFVSVQSFKNLSTEIV